MSNNPLQSIPPVTRNILIAVVVMFLVQQILGQSNGAFIYQYFPLYPIASDNFYPWQLITYALINISLINVLFSCYAIWMFGSQIEHYWGEAKFGLYVVACILGAAIPAALFGNYAGFSISPVVYGILFAFGMMWPNHTIQLLLPPIPVKAKYLVAVFGGLILLSNLGGSGINITQIMMLLGSVGAGFLLIQYWRKKPPFKR